MVLLELSLIAPPSSAAISCNKPTIQVFINHVPLSDLGCAMMWIALSISLLSSTSPVNDLPSNRAYIS